MPARSPPLATTRIGDSVRVVNGKAEWSQEDFAEVFLSWLVMADANYRNGWVWFPDIRKHLFKRFTAETGCRYLRLGTLVRGLGSVTQKREVTHADITGRRRTTTEYWVGDVLFPSDPTAVVELAAAERKRA